MANPDPGVRSTGWVHYSTFTVPLDLTSVSGFAADRL